MSKVEQEIQKLAADQVEAHLEASHQPHTHPEMVTLAAFVDDLAARVVALEAGSPQEPPDEEEPIDPPDEPPDEEEPPQEPPPPPPPPSGSNILGVDLAGLPTSGEAFERVPTLAQKSGTLDLGDMNGPGNDVLLAKAAMGDIAGVLAMLRAAKNRDGAGGLNNLGPARNLVAWAIAASLVGAHEEDDWFRDARDRPYGNIGPIVYPGGGAAKANNHGSGADQSVAAIDLLIGDRAHLEAKLIPVFRHRLGDPGQKVDGQQVSLNPKDPVVVGPVGYKVGGVNADGLLMEEQRRSGGFPNCGNYNFGASGQFLLTAHLLHVAGYPVLDWGDGAIRRIFAALQRIGCDSSGDDRWQGHLVKRLLGVEYLSLGVGDGKSFGLTDLLFGG